MRFASMTLSATNRGSAANLNPKSYRGSRLASVARGAGLAMLIGSLLIIGGSSAVGQDDSNETGAPTNPGIVTIGTPPPSIDPNANSSTPPDQSTIGPAPSGPSCAWIPHDELKPDAGNCGFNDLSVPIAADYQCGKDSQCNDICRFDHCAGP